MKKAISNISMGAALLGFGCAGVGPVIIGFPMPQWLAIGCVFIGAVFYVAGCSMSEKARSLLPKEEKAE